MSKYGKTTLTLKAYKKAAYAGTIGDMIIPGEDGSFTSCTAVRGPNSWTAISINEKGKVRVLSMKEAFEYFKASKKLWALYVPKIEHIAENQSTRYILEGRIEVSLWGGGYGWKWLKLYVPGSKIGEIRENPLQDYISFGVESVDYAVFDVYKETSETVDDAIITKRELYPSEHIEKGVPVIIDKETQSRMAEDFTNVAIVYY